MAWLQKKTTFILTWKVYVRDNAPERNCEGLRIDQSLTRREAVL